MLLPMFHRQFLWWSGLPVLQMFGIDVAALGEDGVGSGGDGIGRCLIGTTVTATTIIGSDNGHRWSCNSAVEAV